MATAFAARGWQGRLARAVLQLVRGKAGGGPTAVAVLRVPPDELLQKAPNTTCFLVDARPFRRGICNARNMAVSCDLPPEQTAIKLYPVGA